MPRYYFHLTSKDSRLPDDDGKELASLNDAYEYGRKLIYQIMLHVGCEDAEAWNVIISSSEDGNQIIMPFYLSYRLLNPYGLNTARPR
jgi:hypothetical protein